jgi:hypothetical protein
MQLLLCKQHQSLISAMPLTYSSFPPSAILYTKTDGCQKHRDSAKRFRDIFWLWFPRKPSLFFIFLSLFLLPSTTYQAQATPPFIPFLSFLLSTNL